MKKVFNREELIERISCNAKLLAQEVCIPDKVIEMKLGVDLLSGVECCISQNVNREDLEECYRRFCCNAVAMDMFSRWMLHNVCGLKRRYRYSFPKVLPFICSKKVKAQEDNFLSVSVQREHLKEFLIQAQSIVQFDDIPYIKEVPETDIELRKELQKMVKNYKSPLEGVYYRTELILAKKHITLQDTHRRLLPIF